MEPGIRALAPSFEWPSRPTQASHLPRMRLEPLPPSKLAFPAWCGRPVHLERDRSYAHHSISFANAKENLRRIERSTALVLARLLYSDVQTIGCAATLTSPAPC